MESWKRSIKRMAIHKFTTSKVKPDARAYQAVAVLPEPAPRPKVEAEVKQAEPVAKPEPKKPAKPAKPEEEKKPAAESDK